MEILHGLDELRVPYRTVPLAEGVRTNLTLTEPDGTTTKINEPGPSLDSDSIEKLAHLLVLESERADWAKDLGVKRFEDGMEILYSPGCYLSACSPPSFRWPPTPRATCTSTA